MFHFLHWFLRHIFIWINIALFYLFVLYLFYCSLSAAMHDHILHDCIVFCKWQHHFSWSNSCIVLLIRRFWDYRKIEKMDYTGCVIKQIRVRADHYILYIVLICRHIMWKSIRNTRTERLAYLEIRYLNYLSKYPKENTNYNFISSISH